MNSFIRSFMPNRAASLATSEGVEAAEIDLPFFFIKLLNFRYCAVRNPYLFNFRRLIKISVNSRIDTDRKMIRGKL